MRNEDIPKELEDQAIWKCKIQKIDILWLKGPFLATGSQILMTVAYVKNESASNRLNFDTLNCKGNVKNESTSNTLNYDTFYSHMMKKTALS